MHLIARNAARKSLAAAICGTLAMGIYSGVGLAEETGAKKATSILDTSSAYIKDYLSDPRRSGSLAGSILGGALSAHPAGPILGSLFGFLIGKQSMFDEDKVRANQASLLYARRDIVPQQGEATMSLSFEDSRGISFSTAVPNGAANMIPVDPAASVGFSNEQIAAMCAGQSRIDPRLQSLCFYSHGS